jgi:hypothetical protein
MQVLHGAKNLPTAESRIISPKLYTNVFFTLLISAENISMSHASRTFYFAFPVKDIEETRGFYTNIAGCSVDRGSERWIDFNFHGHQISDHLKLDEIVPALTSPVDGENVPARHWTGMNL